MTFLQRGFAALSVAATGLFAPQGANAGEVGVSQPWQLGFQASASPVMDEIVGFHDMLLIVTAAIVAFVMALLLIVFVRFNARANPTPSQTTHNTTIEVIWTVVPILILVFIAVPSLKLLYFGDKAVDADFTIKATASQWYWTYEYPDHGDFVFDSLLVADEDLQPGQHRLLETDTRIVVPVGAKVRLLTTANDVIHAWAVPALGVKIDAVPGRINEAWFQVTREGVYYGQCSELCGKDHGYMPIVVEAVSQEAFDAWVKMAQEDYASVGASPVWRLADARGAVR